VTPAPLPAKQALLDAGWQITAEPYVLSYGNQLHFATLAAIPQDAASMPLAPRIVVESRIFAAPAPLTALEQAVGWYTLYRFLLNVIDPHQELYLAVSKQYYLELTSNTLGDLVIHNFPLRWLIIDTEHLRIHQWIPAPPTVPSSSK
jgi:hypothetical protein